MKPQDLVTMKISEATSNQYTTSIPMAAGPRENWEKIGTPPQEGHQRNFDQRSAQGSQRGRAPNRG
jgi:hypothetical protein